MRITPRRLVATVVAPALLLAVATASTLAQGAPPPSNGGSTGSPGIIQSWAVSPGDGTPATAGRSNLSYELAPGTDVDDQITIYNLSNVGMTFKVYATDAFNTEDGAFSLLEAGKKATDVGTWVTLPAEGVSLAAGMQATMPIKIKVPIDTKPGDHAGAILASSSVQGTGPNNAAVNVDRRTGTRVYVRVAGPLHPKLAVEDLSTTYSSALNPLGGTAVVHYKIVNRGNVRLAGTHKVKLSGPFGVFGKSSSQTAINELLPGQSVTVTRELSGVAATVLLRTTVELQPKPVAIDSDPLKRADKRSSTFAIPLLIVALAVIALLLWFARRRYQHHGTSPMQMTKRPGTDREPQPA